MKLPIASLQLLKQWRSSLQRMPRQSNAEKGFTLLEVLVVTIMLAILAAMGIPSWLALANNSRLKKAIVPAEAAIKEAQGKAKQRKETWEAKFREDNGKIQWSVHSYIGEAGGNENWQTIDVDGVQFDLDNSAIGDDLAIQFDNRGTVVNTADVEGKITLAMNSNTSKKRCVKVTTILGSTRILQNNECLTP
ncbi:MAG: type II secretion system protein [Cyanobacteria bacterium J007]|jgi:prepilin-type N-terminal cleavage/methylation domain-containing protein|nr:MAG: type II secretion system protein [Cyanobacteria bacterium J007]